MSIFGFDNIDLIKFVSLMNLNIYFFKGQIEDNQITCPKTQKEINFQLLPASTVVNVEVYQIDHLFRSSAQVSSTAGGVPGSQPSPRIVFCQRELSLQNRWKNKGKQNLSPFASIWEVSQVERQPQNPPGNQISPLWSPFHSLTFSFCPILPPYLSFWCFSKECYSIYHVQTIVSLRVCLLGH